MEIPCKAYMQLGEWQNVGTMKVQDKAPLLLKSTIPCMKGDTIKITHCGQKNIPINIDVKGAPVPAIKITRVKKIELITPLDEGSANDNKELNQPGMIFGKKYKFKVTEFADGKPNSNSSIKWMYKYHNLTENKWIEKKIDTTGDTLMFKMDEKERCGRYIYVRAYLVDPETEGEIKKWHHNRFRWFDRLKVEEEINERTDNKKPWLVNQSGTSLCGMACIFYLFAKEQPQNYKKFAKQLFRTGEATFNEYTAKPSIEILEKKINPKGLPLGTSNMPLVDYITMAGTRNTDNKSYKGGDEEFQAINWPPLITDLSEKLLGYKEVKSKGVYNPIFPISYNTIEIENKISDINEQFRAGYKLILMIDSDLIQDVWDFKSLDLHWVVLESEISEVSMFNKKGQIDYYLDFRVYTWGTDPNNNEFLILNKKTGKTEENSKYHFLKRPITKRHFMNNYNGYIKVK